LKFVIVIIDGAADLPRPALGNVTPLEAAHIPTLDWMAARGSMGTVNMVPKGLAPGSDVAIMSLFGYDPAKYYTGRAPIEAEAQGLKLGPGQWVFRCNLVTIQENIMKDHSAGNIPTEKARFLMTRLNAECPVSGVRFYPGVGYRNLMTTDREIAAQTIPPHDILEQNIAGFLPRGEGGAELCGLIDWSKEVLAGVNNHAATHIWLWGQGKRPTLPLFRERFGKTGAVITAVDLVRGLGRLIGWEVIEVKGATGDFHTDYHGKGLAAIQALSGHDVTCVHIEAPDEAGHKGDPLEKQHALENIDAKIITPILHSLQDTQPEWSLLVLPDHPTPCAVRTHTPDPVPFVLLRHSHTKTVAGPVFSEKAAAARKYFIKDGHTLMEKMIRGGIGSP
jgi:2,3-bisphosphoglycerate-independent phosphoglycerate mutase